MRPLVQAMFERKVVALVNMERRRAGQPALLADDSLAAAARGHSADMSARRFFGHATPDGIVVADRVTAAGYRWSRVGENIAAGQHDPRSVMTAWMASRGHRANILTGIFVHIGVGVAADARGGLVWTQNFGTPVGVDR